MNDLDIRSFKKKKEKLTEELGREEKMISKLRPTTNVERFMR